MRVSVLIVVLVVSQCAAANFVLIANDPLNVGTETFLFKSDVVAPTSFSIQLLDSSNQTLSSVSDTSTNAFQRFQLGVTSDVSYVVVSGGFTARSPVKVGVASAKKRYALIPTLERKLYKPGQTIKCAVVVVDDQLKPPVDLATLGDVTVTLQTPSKIKVWRNSASPSEFGLVKFEIPTDSQAALGDYRVLVEFGDASKEIIATIDAFVLPRFSAEISVAAPYVAPGITNLVGTLKSTYSFGKPVKGSATITLLQDTTNFNNYGFPSGGIPVLFDAPPQQDQLVGGASSTSTSQQYTVLKTIDISSFDGSAPFNFDINSLGVDMNKRSLRIEAVVTESGTNIDAEAQRSIDMYPTEHETLVSTEQSTWSLGGRNNVIKITTQKWDKTPVQSSVDIRISYQAANPSLTPPQYAYVSPTLFSNVDTATPWTFEIPAPTATAAITSALVTVSSPTTGYTTSASVSRFVYVSPKFVRISSKSSGFVGDQFSVAAVASDGSPTDGFSFVLKTAASIVQLDSAASFLLTPEMMPEFSVLVYGEIAGELVGASKQIKVGGPPSRNQVEIALPQQPSHLPGSAPKLVVSTTSASLVALVATDKSLSFLEDDDSRITLSSLVQTRLGFLAASSSAPPQFVGSPGVHQIFTVSGCLLLTSGYSAPPGFAAAYQHWQLPVGVQLEEDAQFANAAGGPAPVAVADGAVSSPANLQEPTRTRVLFPETWLWHFSESSCDATSGQCTAVVEEAVPDTITSWQITSFAVSKTDGIGASSDTPSELLVLQPLFIDAKLPYSVVLGEQLRLAVSVFNYLNVAQTVVVELEQSTMFHSDATSSSFTLSVPPNDQMTSYITIKPTLIGRIPVTLTARSTASADKVTRELLVQPGGAPQEQVDSFFLNLSPGGAEVKHSSVSRIPATAIPGSTRTFVRLTGDLLGSALQNLDSLIRLPSGCGEQTMLTFGPSISASLYLKSTNQLKGDVLDKAKRFLESGYQRELTYFHDDNSVSAFGQSDDSGSTWLTAFVLQMFSAAKSVIYVDDSVILGMTQFLSSIQNADGTFQIKGNLIHVDMSGGVDAESSDVAMASFVLLSLVEGGVADAAIVQKTVAYLESKAPTLTSLYTMSITAYALQRAQSSSGAKRSVSAGALVDRLIMMGDSSDPTTLSWPMPPPPQTGHNSWKRRPSADVETAAYVLLTLVARNRLADALPIVRYLIGQRNSRGGFHSTQDTVVALRALGQFAHAVYSPASLDFSVDIVGVGSLTVDHQNFDLLQTLQVDQGDSATVSLSASGSGSGVAEVVRQWHIAEEHFVSDIYQIEVVYENMHNGGHSIRVCVAPAAGKGEDGMIIAEIGLFSGFEANVATTTTLVGVGEIKRIEHKDRAVVFYLSKLASSQCFSFEAIERHVVLDRAEVASRVYSYYNPTVQSVLRKSAPVNEPLSPALKGAIAAIVVSVALTLALVITGVVYLQRKRAQAHGYTRSVEDESETVM